MKINHRSKKIGLIFVILLLMAFTLFVARPETEGWTLTGWNNLGMHCMDADYSVFSLLPPYNTIHAQLSDPSGRLVTDPAGITITYEGVGDQGGSINTSSAEKTNFWQFVLALFGSSPAPDAGLTGNAMPGVANSPQPMEWNAASNWFVAEGIPITPYDDVGNFNPYPMMHLVARDAAGSILAATDIVLPVSDEMGCSTCHASGGDPMAQPLAGWVNDPDEQRDFRLNILRLHDERQISSPAFRGALDVSGYDPAGLYSTAVDGKPILCARCHVSNALPGTGIQGIPALTSSEHTFHGHVMDDATGMPLDSLDNRSACYNCHPGSATRCLRGVMGGAVAGDGIMSMQCQSCHGNMSAVGAMNRAGWLQEPTCQNCHTGSASHNNGEMRYTSVFESDGQPRQAVDSIFATDPDAPAAGYSLFRFSHGHGGLACEACHGSTHAEFPSTHDSDNIQSVNIQGYAGPLAECAACHGNQELSPDGGPHGMHSLGQSWSESHSGFMGRVSIERCQACHGNDYAGTVLSRAQGARTISTQFGVKKFWKGYQVGCYSCHNGPNDNTAYPGDPPVADEASGLRFLETPVRITLTAHDTSGTPLTLRVVNQPRHGAAGIQGTVATYVPYSDYTGADSFTFAASDGKLDSNLAGVTLSEADSPVISAIALKRDPLAIIIFGGNIQAGARVYVGDDISPWPNTVIKSSSLLKLKGPGAIRSSFPKGTEVSLTVVNPDEGTAAGSFTR